VDEKAQEVELKAQSEAGLAAKAVEKAKKVGAKATRKAAQEAKREAKEAKRAALKAKKEAKLAAKAVEKAKKVEAKATRRDEILARQERNKRATVDQRAEEAEAELAKEVELAPIERTEKEAREAKEKARRETEEAREVGPDAEAAAKVKATKEVNAQLYEGTINLVLMPPVGVLQINNLEEKLRLIQNLRVILTGGSVDKPIRIVVSAEQPIPLIDVLNHIPIVDEVTKKGKEIQILLKTGA
jgi:hypothetical protein